MDKFNNKYRIPSARATWWNYADNAPYFVTICTKHRECFFGDIVETQYFASPSAPHDNAVNPPTHDNAVNPQPHENGVIPESHDNAVSSPSGNKTPERKQNIEDAFASETQNIALNAELQNIGDAFPSETQNIALHAELQNIGDAFASETQNIASLRNPVMQLSPIGEIAHACWLSIPEHFPFVKLGEFVVMPDHVHGIIIIDKPETKKSDAQLQANQFGPQSKNLASIVRGYKVGVTKNAKLLNPNFGWQTRYYDHIIQSEDAFNNISTYIINNPKNYKKNSKHKSDS